MGSSDPDQNSEWIDALSKLIFTWLALYDDMLLELCCCALVQHMHCPCRFYSHSTCLATTLRAWQMRHDVICNPFRMAVHRLHHLQASGLGSGFILEAEAPSLPSIAAQVIWKVMLEQGSLWLQEFELGSFYSEISFCLVANKKCICIKVKGLFTQLRIYTLKDKKKNE